MIDRSVAGASSAISCPASRRASRSRSLTSRSMRVVWRKMTCRNCRVCAVVALLEQRLDVAPDRRERRTKFVRHIADEIPAYLVGALQVGHIVQDEHDARPQRVAGRSGASDEHTRRIRAKGELDAWRRFAAQRACDLRHDVRMADRVGVTATDPGIGNTEHPARCRVHEPHAPVAVQHQHAFDHPREDGLHARPIAREIRQARAELEHHAIERARHAPELVPP